MKTLEEKIDLAENNLKVTNCKNLKTGAVLMSCENVESTNKLKEVAEKKLKINMR
jgi:hypothetical protein